MLGNSARLEDPNRSQRRVLVPRKQQPEAHKGTDKRIRRSDFGQLEEALVVALPPNPPPPPITGGREGTPHQCFLSLSLSPSLSRSLALSHSAFMELMLTCAIPMTRMITKDHHGRQDRLASQRPIRTERSGPEGIPPNLVCRPAKLGLHVRRLPACLPANANALFFIYLFLFLLVGGYSCADTRLPVLVLNIMKGTCAMGTAPTKFTLSRRRASS